ncbi:MAG: hypothetical protein AMJ62_02305 [Myxococcales bacterium SG8_38]|nr:MAG: hypothetical protein AMJ62_02305 [Myxococcales bacterium SG8_38]
MRPIALSTILGLLLFGCGDSSSVDGSAGSGGSGGNDFVVTMSHTYDALPLEVGGEISNVCQTWVLDNDEPLYVTKVRQINEGGWHHSNWFFVPEWAYEPDPEVEGPDATVDGSWKCSDRSFREYLAAAAGGVFFAQSTQALDESQVFPDGAVLEIPPRSAIVGSVHLLNISAAPMESALTMEVETVPADQAEIRLTPFSFSNTELDIPPGPDPENGQYQESRFSMTCDLTETFQKSLGMATPDYNVYYVLAHYHEWGNYFNLSFTHENGSRQTILELVNRVGEPIGRTINPPMSNNGAPALTVDCGYINTTDETLVYGLGGQEMCVFLAYTDSGLKVGSSADENHPMGEDENGILLNETDCGPITAFKADFAD